VEKFTSANKKTLHLIFKSIEINCTSLCMFLSLSVSLSVSLPGYVFVEQLHSDVLTVNLFSCDDGRPIIVNNLTTEQVELSIPHSIRQVFLSLRLIYNVHCGFIKCLASEDISHFYILTIADALIKRKGKGRRVFI